MVTLNLTPEEKQIIIKELAERIKDLVYANAQQRTEEAINLLLKCDLKPDEPIQINFTYQFLITDLIQIVGRHRRTSQGV